MVSLWFPFVHGLNPWFPWVSCRFKAAFLGDPRPRRAVGSEVSSDRSAESPQSPAPGNAMGDAQGIDMMMGYHIRIYLFIVSISIIYIDID